MNISYSLSGPLALAIAMVLGWFMYAAVLGLVVKNELYFCTVLSWSVLLGIVLVAVPAIITHQEIPSTIDVKIYVGPHINSNAKTEE